MKNKTNTSANKNGIVLDSFVDEITNSSTVIYTYARTSAIGMIKQFIQDLLDELGSDKTPDDLYEFKITYDDPENIAEAICEQDGERDPEQVFDDVKNGVDLKDEYDFDIEDAEYCDNSTSLIVTSKSTGKAVDLNKMFGAKEGAE